MLKYLIGATISAAISIAAPSVVFAQSETPSWDPVAAGQLGVLVDGTRQTPRGRWQGAPSGATPASSSSRARATCANKSAARAKLGANHPQVRKLYELCAQAGY